MNVKVELKGIGKSMLVLQIYKSINFTERIKKYWFRVSLSWEKDFIIGMSRG